MLISKRERCAILVGRFHPHSLVHHFFDLSGRSWVWRHLFVAIHLFIDGVSVMRSTWAKHVGHLRLCRGFHERLSEVFSLLNRHRLIQGRVDLRCELALSQLHLLLLRESIDLFVIKVFEVLLGHFPQLLIAFQ